MSTFLMVWLWVHIISYVVYSESNEEITIMQISQNKAHTRLSIKLLTAIQNDFYKLSNPEIISTPSENPNDLDFMIVADEDSENECIHDDLQELQCCFQSFIISSINTDKQCPLSLKGSFSIQFDIDCSEATEMSLSACTEYKESNGGITSLQVSTSYTDSICDNQIFSVGQNSKWTHLMTFFHDGTYTEQLGENELYEPYDTCYAQLEIYHPSLSSYDVTEIHLQNIWLCSAPPTTDLFAEEGCFDEDVDQNSAFWIVRNGGSSMQNAVITSEINDASTGITTIKFQFTIPEMSRDTLYIHNQLAIEIGNQITLFMNIFEHVNIKHVFTPFYDFKRNIMYLNSDKWMVLLGIFTCVLMFVMVILMVSMKMFCEDEDATYDTDEDELLRKPIVKKIRINNKELVKCEDNEAEDDSEYVDYENDNDPLDQSY